MSTLILRVIRFSYRRVRFLDAALYSSQPEKADKNVGKVVNVAIIGAPNSGKSTLINKIVERKICAASNKVHTTTKMIRAMCFEDDTQIVFLDTPGVITDIEQKKYNLPDSMIGACQKGLRCADVIGVVHDVSNRHTKDALHQDVTNMLKLYDDTPSFLIINKVDKLKTKTQILSIIRNLCNGHIAGNPMPGVDKRSKFGGGYGKFSDVFLVSALNGDGVMDIKQYLMNNAKAAGFQYAPAEITDQKPETLITEAVRAKFLDFLHQEIPYKLKIDLEYFEDNVEDNKIVCSVSVEAPSERIAKLIAGAGGGRLQQIKSSVRTDLVQVFGKIVILDLQLKSKQKSSGGS